MPTTLQSGRSSKSDQSNLQARIALAELRNVVQHTSPSSAITKLSSSVSSRAYNNFMAQNAGRTVDSVAGAFYEGPASQNGRRLFYFLVARINLVDYDLLAYHVFSTLQRVNEAFDLIIDLTDFSPATDLPVAWLGKQLQMCPPHILPLIHVSSVERAHTHTLNADDRPLLSQLIRTAKTPENHGEPFPCHPCVWQEHRRS